MGKRWRETNQATALNLLKVEINIMFNILSF